MRAVSIVVRRQLNRAAVRPTLANKRTALRRRAAGRVRDCKEREQRAEDDRRVLGARDACGERVALACMSVVGDGAHDKVGAVCSDHASLSESAAGVGILHSRVDADERDDDAQRQVERDEETVEGARAAGKETVHDTCEGDHDGIQAGSAAN